MPLKPSNDDLRDVVHTLPDANDLRSYDRTKDVSTYPLFIGGISRWCWRLWMFRVTQAGRWFLGLCIILTFYGVSSIDLQIYVPLMYAFGIFVVTWLIALIFPPRVSVDVSVPDRVAVGSAADIPVAIKSKSRWPLVNLNLIAMRLPLSVDFQPKLGVNVPELRPGLSAKVHIFLHCRKRGIYKIKGFRVESSFPLDLFYSYTAHWKNDTLLVYPKFSLINHIDLPLGQRYQPGGVALASTLGDSLEFIGNRDYREGDNVRDIDWRATARLTRPIVREYREEYFHRAGVILDTFVPKANINRDADFERAVSICASVADYMSREEFVVDLFAAGPMLYHLTAGRNLAFQDQILDILACLEPVTSEPFQVIENELAETLSQLTTVVCVFLDWNPVRQAFVDKIREITAVKVVIVRNAACTVDPIPFAAELSLSVINAEIFDRGVYEL